MAALGPEKLSQLRGLLEQTHSTLEQQLSLGKLAASVVKLDQTTVGRVSRVDAMQQQSMAVSTREMAAQRLRKVQLALRNLDNGCYGFCSSCDEEIAPQRLLAKPEATTCLGCQDKLDRQQ